jgi:hypothetical protein
LGILNATKKASADIVAPKKDAITISLTRPRILLIRVKNETTPAALPRLPFSLLLIFSEELFIIIF